MPLVPATAEEISTREEARLYYQKHLARAHDLVCYGRPVTVYFEPGATHRNKRKFGGDEKSVGVYQSGNRHEFQQSSGRQHRSSEE